MGFFEQEENKLIFRENGETVWVEAWGADSLRVRSAMLSDIADGSVALSDNIGNIPYETSITIDEWEATISNGNIKAVLTVQPWGRALQMSFYNAGGELLLREISNGGALMRKARHFKPLQGGDFRLKVSFEGQQGEKGGCVSHCDDGG